MKELIIVVFALWLYKLLDIAYEFFIQTMQDDIDLYHARTKDKIKKI